MATTQLPFTYPACTLPARVERDRQVFSRAALDPDVRRAAATGKRPNWGHADAAVTAGLLAALLRKVGHLPPVRVPADSDDTRTIGTLFEVEVLFPCIDAHASELVADLNAQLAADGLALRATSIRRSHEQRSSYDAFVDIASPEGPYTVSINFKYGAGDGSDNVAGETSLFGDGMVGKRVRLKKAVEAQRGGHLNGGGYMVAHLQAGERTLAGAAAVYEVFAVEPDLLSWNRKNGVQAQASACGARMLELADQRVPLEFAMCAERIVTWVVAADIEANLDRVAMLTELLPESHPLLERVPALVAAAFRQGASSHRELQLFGETATGTPADAAADEAPHEKAGSCGGGSRGARRKRDHRATYQRRLTLFLSFGYRSERDARHARRTGVGLRRQDPEAIRVSQRLGSDNVVWAT